MSAFAQSLFPQYAQWGFYGGLALVLTGIAMFLWAMFHRSTEATGKTIAVGDTYNNSGNNFGHMGPIHIGKPAFELTQDHINQVLGHLTKGRPVIVQAVGNQRAWGMGEVMANAIRAAGFSVTRENIGMLVPVPESPIAVSHQGNATYVTIAPNA